MLPYCINEHCTLQLNATYTMIILGENYDMGVYGSTETFFFNHETNQFMEGPKLIRGRYRFACGLFQKNGRETIIVAGGYAHSNGYPFDSVEYMYLDELVWREGEQKLEIPRDDYVAMFVPDELVSCTKRNH